MAVFVWPCLSLEARQELVWLIVGGKTPGNTETIECEKWNNIPEKAMANNFYTVTKKWHGYIYEVLWSQELRLMEKICNVHIHF